MPRTMLAYCISSFILVTLPRAQTSTTPSKLTAVQIVAKNAEAKGGTRSQVRRRRRSKSPGSKTLMSRPPPSTIRLAP